MPAFSLHVFISPFEQQTGSVANPDALAPALATSATQCSISSRRPSRRRRTDATAERDDDEEGRTGNTMHEQAAALNPIHPPVESGLRLCHECAYVQRMAHPCERQLHSSPNDGPCMAAASPAAAAATTAAAAAATATPAAAAPGRAGAQTMPSQTTRPVFVAHCRVDLRPLTPPDTVRCSDVPAGQMTRRVTFV
jgi:hypothetical protein